MMRPGEYKICVLCDHHECHLCQFAKDASANPLKWRELKTQGSGAGWFLLMPDGVPSPTKIKMSDWIKKRKALKN